MTTKLKVCTKCKDEKPESEFYTTKKARSDGSIGTYLRASYKTCENLRSKEYHNANKDRASKRHKKWRNMARYGLSLEEYDKKHEKQSGKCAICSNEATGIHSLAVDHDHVTGVVRDLLCGNCNNGLGRFKDSIDLLTKAADYLRRHGGI